MVHSKLEIDQTDRFLKAVEVLSPLTDQQRSKIAGALEDISYEDGDTLWDVGDRADWLCLIREGRVVSTSSYREPLSFSVGSFFGTQALKGDPNTKRIAKVVAEGPVKAYRLTRKSVNELFGDLSALIKRNMTMKLIPAIEIFKALSSAEIEVLVDSAHDSTFAAGEVVIQEGELKSLVYVIKDGAATKDDETLSQGACFGEEAFTQAGLEYGSTVVASEALTCLTIDCQRFKSSSTVRIAETLRTTFAKTQQRRSVVVRNMPRKEDLLIKTLLGVGSFGRVRLVWHEQSSMHYALKCMNKGLIIARKQVLHVQNEKAILAMCSHPFLITLAGWYQDDTELYMLFELVLGGELFSILSKSIFTEATCRFYAANVASAFEYLHERKIAYRDLKPENLLIDEKGYLKVADFGFAKVVEDRTWTLCGTPDYLAPETITCKGHGCAVDWWALGILLYELLTGFPPFSADDQVETFKRILSAKLSYPDVARRGHSPPPHRQPRQPARRQRRAQCGHAFFHPIDFVRLISRELHAVRARHQAPRGHVELRALRRARRQRYDVHRATPPGPFVNWESAN